MSNNPFLGEIFPVAEGFVPDSSNPQNFAACNGQILSVATNTALFIILGGAYGGDGATTFALPDLRGRVPMHAGQGPGLSNRMRGEKLGDEAVALTSQQMPIHSHTPNASSSIGTSANPQGNLWAASSVRDLQYSQSASTASMSSDALSSVGGGQAHNTMPPYLTLNFIIAITGIFPT